MFRPIVTGKNPSNNVLIYWDTESQGNLLSNSRTAPRGIALLCLDNGFNEFSGRSLWTGLAPFPWVRRVADTFDSSELGEDLRESKASERLRNGSDGRDESEEHTARQQGDLKNVD